MANNLTIKSKGYGERYMQVYCKQTPNGSDKNSSTIDWTLSAIGDDVWYDTGPTALVINGTTVCSIEFKPWEYGKFPVAQGSTSGSITIPHNTDGTKKITVKLSTAIYYHTVEEYSKEWELDPIQRYATIEHSLSSKTETSATINWKSDKVIDYLWYSINDGTSWVGVGTVNDKNGSYTINGLTANTTYKVKTRVRGKESQLNTDSKALEVTTYDYPHCIESPNFVIGETVELKFYNPLRHTIGFNIIANGVKLTYDWTAEGTTYRGLYAEGVQTQLYNAIPNAQSGKYQVVVTYGSVVRTRNNGNTFSVDPSKCLPEFTDFSYADTSNIANNTGNSQVLVKNLSVLSVTIAENQKMVARNGAKPDKYVISIDTKSETVNYAETAVSANIGSIANKGIMRLTVRATDSRGFSTAVYKDVTVYDYEKPVINVDVKRLNNFESQTTLKVNGSFSRVAMANGVDANTVRFVYYRYRESGGTWSTATRLETFITSYDKTQETAGYSCTDVVLTLDNGKAFELEVLTYDAMSYDTVNATVNVGQAIFFISTNQKSCYINGQKLIMYDVVDTWGGW